MRPLIWRRLDYSLDQRLTWWIAIKGGQASIAIARLMASSAARTAVDAAVRIAGPEGYRDGVVARAPIARRARD